MTTNLATLSPLQTVALAKAVTDRDSVVKNARRVLVPGIHQVPEFTVEISGTLEISADEQYTPTTSISLIGLCCLAVKRMGIQRDPFLAKLREICQEALTVDEQTRAAIMAEADVEGFMLAFREEFTSQLPSKTRLGRIHRKGLETISD